MTRTVWKFTIDLKKDGIDPILEIPGGGHFLFVKDQVFDQYGLMNDPQREMKIDTWWAVDTDREKVPIQLYIRGTGQEIPPSTNYLGTVFPTPVLVLHIWNRDRVFDDMHIVDGKFVSKSQ